MAETSINYWDIVRQKYLSEGFDQETTDIILNNWRNNTKNNYATYLKLWVMYTKNFDVDLIKPKTSEALSFLTKMFKEGFTKNQIYSARSALSVLFNNENNPCWGKTFLSSNL